MRLSACVLGAAALAVCCSAQAQTAGAISGTVTDPSGAVVSGAAVNIENPTSHLSRSATSDSEGHFQFSNLPMSSYHLTVTAPGFSPAAQDVAVASAVPVAVKSVLSITAQSQEITVTASDLVNSRTDFESDIERSGMEKLPLESQSSGLSSLVTESSPGIASDSNGLFHALGDHASNQFSVDGQPITDQQSKVFSNQLPTNSVQSMQVIEGAPPAEYGGKTSLVVDVTTRSGQGVKTPTGSITTSYGTFGSSTAAVDLSYGGDKWGNFFELDGLDTGRFLDPPEFVIFHAKGNEFNYFDRLDRQFTQADSVRLNVSVSRSWFQTPNAYDNLNVRNVVANGATDSPTFATVGNTDQRSKIVTFNIAPTWTHTIGSTSILSAGGWVRRDGYHYYPSGNPLADLSPIQSQSIAQNRSLLNAGARADYSYIHGIHNFKAGVEYNSTFLREHDQLGIANPFENSPCVNSDGAPVAGYGEQGQCAAGGLAPNPGYVPALLPYDLTRGGGHYSFFGHTDVKEIALYLQDEIKAGNWTLNVGIRGDLYNGLAVARQAEPRLGLAYNIKQTNSVVRASYARTLETPFNENLVLSSVGCGSDVLAPLLNCTPGVSTTLQPGFRNEFHVGAQQAVGKNFVISGEYLWKYTHNAFDFSVLGNTPITFPIDWHNSKVQGLVLKADVPNFHNFSAYLTVGSVTARFFPPQVAGAGATVGQSGYPFRIDHDEPFNQTTHIQYQLPSRRVPAWFGFNWRYESGMAALSAPCYNATDPNSNCNPSNGGGSILINGQAGIDLTRYSADEQFQAGLACNGVRATPNSGFAQCLASQLTSSLISLPKPGTEDDDKHPPRIAGRNLFDLSLGDDNLFHGDKKTWSLHLTGVNIANKYALYNFLSTFSGTHYVTPRTMTAELGFHF